MKKLITLLLSLLMAFSLCFTAACSDNDANTADFVVGSAKDADDDYSSNEGDTEVDTGNNDDAVTVDDSDGYTVYTITTAGTYTFSNTLYGRIVVDAGEDDEVIIVLDGCTINSTDNSCIFAVNADNVKVKAQSGTYNQLNDNRSAKTVEVADQGEGAISAKCDLSIVGQGSLTVNANYNNGIHTTKDLKIKNATVKVTAPNNAIKGKDNVNILSGNLIAISTMGDGMKTENTDISSKGNQRGSITITGGTVNIYAAGDGIQAAYNFVMEDDGDSTIAEPTVEIFTGSYSNYTASSAATDSYKGIKVENELGIACGNIILHTYDDGLHANYGTAFENGSTGLGKITISGGTITDNVYSPSTSAGNGGGMGWGGQQTVTGADGIHSDNTLTISGGTVKIQSAYEGLEANHIIISGGTTYVYATDDGINASKKINQTPSIVVSGGYLDVTVSSGDVDGIDSNGSYTQSGGIVITRGQPGGADGNMAALDCDGTATFTGGTLIAFGGIGA
ncbi:MAG: carbohydrate-binding domain-containing protein, partial [Clostridia bacterium]|nr:carbohydrate-binding domain-containing protein [Clostridia bacterium]